MQAIFDLFGWEVVRYDSIQQGLINRTYSIETTSGNYILQTINHHIFKQPWDIDNNIHSIGNYLEKHFPSYLFTHLVSAVNGKTLIEWEGEYFRAFHKIEGYALSVLDNALQVEQAAKQFGRFTSILSSFPISSLKITLPNFHNLSLRYQQFKEALQHGNPSRIQQSKDPILFLQSTAKLVDQYEHFIQSKEVQLRVTHHDTKISNVLFRQSKSREEGERREEAICVIDLDTVMPGYFISDVGDMCRTCLCPVSEEEANLDLVQVDKTKLTALQNGYLSEMKPLLSNFELDHLFYSGQFLIYMQALRFLTDHLNNDIYYGAKNEGQNYIRTLNQIRLLEAYNELR
jgi:Ser/Thr protein kinase RdoA (MazF antagonist)